MNKKQIVVENISHFDRKMLNEGGIFHINRIEGNKMFATYYYDPKMSRMEFDYQLVSFEESLRRVAESLKWMKKNYGV